MGDVGSEADALAYCSFDTRARKGSLTALPGRPARGEIDERSKLKGWRAIFRIMMIKKRNASLWGGGSWPERIGAAGGKLGGAAATGQAAAGASSSSSHWWLRRRPRGDGHGPGGRLIQGGLAKALASIDVDVSRLGRSSSRGSSRTLTAADAAAQLQL